jgi:hypothetical protein
MAHYNQSYKTGGEKKMPLKLIFFYQIKKPSSTGKHPGE